MSALLSHDASARDYPVARAASRGSQDQGEFPNPDTQTGQPYRLHNIESDSRVVSSYIFIDSIIQTQAVE